MLTLPALLIHQVKRSLTYLAVVLIALGCGIADADDTELYSGLSNTPKVLFVLDVSGSMGWSDRGYTGTRIQRMKEALTTLLADVQGIDVGLMSYSGRAIKLLHEVADVSNQQTRQDLLDIVDALQDGGGTPTVSALHEAALYMRGGRRYRGEAFNNKNTYESPVAHECESSHIVLLTDGEPYNDTAIGSHIQQQYGLSCSPESYASATCGVELATFLADDSKDQFQHVTGNNTITTHSIGFNVDYDWVPRVAAAGTGVYADAASAQDLIDAFNDILDSVEIESAASAPSISINAFNESRHSDKLYYSFFQPYRKPRWDGNVKKYRLHEGEIVDKNDDPVLDTNGLISPGSRSLWANTDDGEYVRDGGMAARQPAPRRWFTDVGVAPTNGTITPFQVTRNNAIPRNALGAANNQERNQLVRWARGFATGSGQPNNYVADSLHNSPVVVTYKANESTSLLEEAVFSANNMGVLHAVRADTGEELWSYSPEELLPNIKKYFDNRDTSHVYGLDGNLVVHTKSKANTVNDYEIDEASLYLTQRRGGKGIFALDITDAMKNTNPVKVMWKIEGGIANTDFADLGQTWATPQIIPVRYGCPNNCQTKEVLMFGGGYNPIYDDKNTTFPTTPEATGHGNAIYMVDPETGELIWSAGNGAHHDLDLPDMNDSIPTTPVPVDTDADGVVDILFVSDVAGHVWRIDLQRAAGRKDELALGGGRIANLNRSGEALRFFNRVDVVISGTTQGTAFFNIVVGSGMRSSPLYDEPIDNRLFVIKDPWVFSYPPGDNIDARTGRPFPHYSYVENSGNTTSIIGPDDLWQHGTADSGGSRRYGYYKIFGERGEKILQPTLTHSGRVFVVSYVPPDPSVRHDACNYNLGESRLHLLDLTDGSNLLPSTYGTYKIVGSGIISMGSIVDTGDGTGSDFVTGLGTEKLVDLFAPTNPNVFRRFVRTGWLEKDDY